MSDNDIQKWDELIEQNPLLQEIISVEPELKNIILRLMNLEPKQGYSWITALETAQDEIKHLVGWYARDKRISHSKYYTEVMDVLRQVVPSDPS